MNNIEDMVNKWFDVTDFRKLSDDDRKSITREIKALLTQQREEAVRGFAEYLMQDMDKDSYHSKESINSAWNEYSWDIERTYLQSLAKFR